LPGNPEKATREKAYSIDKEIIVITISYIKYRNLLFRQG